MDDEPNVWERHAQKMRRQEQLKRIDAWLSALYRDRPILFNLLGIAIGVILASITVGILHLLDRLFP